MDFLWLYSVILEGRKALSISADRNPDVFLESPLSSASLRYSLRTAVTAEGPGPHETRPFGLRFAQTLPTPARPHVRYCHQRQVAVDGDGRPLIEQMDWEEDQNKQWQSKTYSDGDEGSGGRYLGLGRTVTVVIFAENTDIPVDAVVRELTVRDVPVFRADTSSFPRTLTLEALLEGDGRWRGMLRTPHRSVDLSAIRSIWYRHPGAFCFADSMTDVERAYAHREARLGLGGVLASLDVLWINHPNRSAESAYKPLQLAVAARCGLTTTATAITNSPEAVRRFAAASPTGVVRKSLGPNSVTEGNTLTVAFTHRLTSTDLADLSGVDTTATQVQQWVNKIYEVRVVVIGARLFTILIRAGSKTSWVDWRADYPALSYEWIDTPPEIEKGLRHYMARMGLTYAAVDFAIDINERWIFLESNSAGQYFWLEAHTGAPITTALVDALTEGVHP